MKGMSEYELAIAPELKQRECEGCLWSNMRELCDMPQDCFADIGEEYTCGYTAYPPAPAIIVLVHKVTQQPVIPEEIVKRYKETFNE